ncbi:MAG: hypothetical protein Q7T04_07765 [Dehalococcoidia bacterium]|nr:hypothetical protein [Dehalococcoidia bacterium]
MEFVAEDRSRLRRWTAEAISLAMECRWEDAVAANRNIVEIFLNDVEAFNRLGKALTELGRCDEARDAYGRALGIEPNNSIAQKNLRRLSCLKAGHLRPKDSCKITPHLFIEETSKTGSAALIDVAPEEIRAKVSAGDKVELKAKGHALLVETLAAEYLGRVQAKLGYRLSKLMAGGNQYTAAIAGADDTGIKIIIKEEYRHPSQADRPSFPPGAANGFRAYLKGSAIKYELEDEEEQGEAGEDWVNGDTDEGENSSSSGMQIVDTGAPFEEQQEDRS